MRTRRNAVLSPLSVLVMILLFGVGIAGAAFFFGGEGRPGDVSLQKGLVAWWDMDGNANDSTLNHNNGVVTGAALIADRFGIDKKAYNFNGTTDVITAPNSPSLNPTSQVTIGGWVYDPPLQQAGAKNLKSGSLPAIASSGLFNLNVWILSAGLLFAIFAGYFFSSRAITLGRSRGLDLPALPEFPRFNFDKSAKKRMLIISALIFAAFISSGGIIRLLSYLDSARNAQNAKSISPTATAVVDPAKQISDPHTRELVRKQGMNPAYVELAQDYAKALTPAEKAAKEANPATKYLPDPNPYSRTYRDRISGKYILETQGLPMVDADGVKVDPQWAPTSILNFSGIGRFVKPAFQEKSNLFHITVDNAGRTTIVLKNDQPDGRKKNDQLIFRPQIFLNGIAQKIPNPNHLAVDPVNSNYKNNTIEWDYGFVKRRMRLIEGRFLGSWVFPQNPEGDIKIVYNQVGDFRLKLGRYSVNTDTEVVPASMSVSAKYPFEVSDTLTVNPDAHPETSTVDGYIGNSQSGSASWSTIHDAGTGADGSNDNSTQLYASLWSNVGANTWFNIYRIITLFDTSSLGSSVTISAATLSLYGYDKTDTAGWAVGSNIYTSTPASNTSLSSSDYSQLGSSAQSSGVSYASFSTAGYNAYSFTTTSNINKTGISKFGFRYQADGDNSPPAWVSGYQQYRMYSAEQGTGYKPKLVITYTIPVTAPTVTTSAASSVTATTATLNGNITATGGENPTVTVYWGDNDGGTTPGNWDYSSAPTSPSQPQGVAAFTESATGLTPGVKYYFSAKATNSGGTSWGSTQNFTASNSDIIGKGTDAYALGIDSSLNVTGYISGSASSSYQITKAWHHVVMTYDGSNIRLYVDGVLRQTTAKSGAIGANNLDIKLASSMAGKLDDMRVYNRAISQAEITAWYESTHSPGIGVSNLQKKLVGWWRLDGNAKDSSPYRSNGSPIGTTLTTDHQGQANKAYSFNGTSDYISVADNPALRMSGDWTMSAWIKVTDTNKGSGATAQGVWKKNNSFTSATGYGWYVQANQLYINYGNGASYQESGKAYTSTAWTHVVVGVSGSTEFWYYNGVSQGTSVKTGTPASSTDNLEIGRVVQSNSHLFAGSMDDIRVWNRALSATEITDLYDEYDPGIQVSDLQKGLVGWWKYDGNANDSTSSRNHGTATGTGKIADRQGQTSKAYYFNGTTDIVTVPSSSSLNIASKVTAGGWVYDPPLTADSSSSIKFSSAQVPRSSRQLSNEQLKNPYATEEAKEAFHRELAKQPIGTKKRISPYSVVTNLGDNKFKAEFSSLQITNADLSPIDSSWHQDSGKWVAGENLFFAEINGNKVHVAAGGDQPDRNIKAGDDVTFSPQLHIGGKEYKPIGAPKLLAQDPFNQNYHNNVLEWDYGVAKRRLRIIEGQIQGSWVFAKDPRAEARIKYNQSGKIALSLGGSSTAVERGVTPLRVAVVNNDEEVVKPEQFARARAYPVSIGDVSTFTTMSADASFQGTNATYATARSTGTSSSSTATTATVGQSCTVRVVFPYGCTSYDVFRGGLQWDTSSLSDTVVISAGTIYLYPSSDNSAQDFTITIVNGSGLSDTPVTGDHNNLNSATTRTASYNTASGWTGAAYKTLSGLDATGLSEISKTGRTKFGVRSSLDISSTAPTVAGEYVAYYTSEQGAGFQPKIDVTYTDFATITTSAATSITSTTATLNGNVTYTGGNNPTVTVYWGPTDGGTTPGSWANTSAPDSPAQPQGVAAFSKGITGLTTNTTYYFTAKAVNSVGTSWATTNYFTTSSTSSSVVIIGKNRDAFDLEIDGSLNLTAYLSGSASGTYQITKAWHHVVMVYDGAAIKIYVDGVQRVSTAKTGAIVTNPAPLLMGSLMNGKLDDMRVYNRALSQAEITAWYESYQ